MMVLPGPVGDRRRGSANLSCGGISSTWCSMVRHAGLGRRRSSASTGSCMNRLTSASTSPSSVAENSRRCASAGVCASSSVTSGRKPMSAIWSASSSTVISTVVERAGAPLDQVAEPARGGDEDVDAALAARRSACRTARRRTAVLVNSADRLGQRRQRVVDLHGQLAGRHQDQGLGLVRRGPAARGDPGQHRQAERERLAGAGLATAEHVPAGERVRDGRGLDRERRGDLGALERPDQLAGQTELGEADLLGVAGLRFDRGHLGNGDLGQDRLGHGNLGQHRLGLWDSGSAGLVPSTSGRAASRSKTDG